MKRALLIALPFVLWAGAAHAADPIEPTPPTLPTEGDGLSTDDAFLGGKGFLGSYGDFWRKELARIGEMDLYGVSAQLPQGYLSIKWDWGMIKAGSRFNSKRERGPVLPPIEFRDGVDGPADISIDLGLSGQGGGHTFQVSYGIIDELDWYIEFPFTYMDVSFTPKVDDIDDEGNKVSPRVAAALGVRDRKAYGPADFLYNTLPALGRPTPATRFEGQWLLGDINTGFSWNYFRNSRMSAALTGRVFLPTGRTPTPESNLTYGTGPEIEIGVGGWGVGLTQGYDFRIFKHGFWIDIIASTEFTTSYFFEQKRDYPTNFVTPDPAATALDPASFPDLSDLDGTFSYTPGFGMDATAQLEFNVVGVGLGVGYGVQYSQEPWLEADPAFEQMARSLELLGAQQGQFIQLGVAIALVPLYIPVQLAFDWKKVVDGYNTIVFDDFYTLHVKGVLPLYVLWE